MVEGLSVRRYGKAKKRIFLETFAKVGTVRAAAKAAKISRSTHYEWFHHDKEYQADFLAARDDMIDSIEESVLLRARNGVLEPVFYQGKQVAEVRKFSDSLAVLLLKSLRPGKYRDGENDESDTENALIPSEELFRQLADVVFRWFEQRMENEDQAREPHE